MKTAQNWQALARTGWQALLWAALAFCWLLWFDVFCGKMAPRLGYLAGKPIGMDLPCFAPECDFSAFWPAGVLARHGEFVKLYGEASFLAYQHQLFGAASTHLMAFYYPPFTLIPSALISYLPFEVGFFIWVIASIGIATWLMRRAEFSWLVILAGLFCPAATWNIEIGQWGILDGALLLAGLAGFAARSWWGGVVLGCLAFKPQAGILVPACLASGRGFRALVLFAATCLFLVALTLALFGPSAWVSYLSAGHAETLKVLNASFRGNVAEEDGISVFWMARSLGASVQIASAIQAVSTLAAMLAAFLIWRSCRLATLDAVVLTALLSLLATPYGYVDDMVAGAWGLAALAERRGWSIGMLDVLFWLWPAFCQPVSIATGILFTPVVVALAVARTMHEAGLLRFSRIRLAA